MLNENKPKVIKLKNMSSNAFMRLLSKYGACSQAKKWAKGKDLAKVMRTCRNAFWLRWLVNAATGSGIIYPKRGWGGRDNYHLVADLASKEYAFPIDWTVGQRRACAVWRKYYKVVEDTDGSKSRISSKSASRVRRTTKTKPKKRSTNR